MEEHLPTLLCIFKHASAQHLYSDLANKYYLTTVTTFYVGKVLKEHNAFIVGITAPRNVDPIIPILQLRECSPFY